MVALYLDENLADKAMARQLEATGHSVYLATGFVPEGDDDDVQLEAATRLRAVLVTRDKADYEKLDHDWREAGRKHAGILRCRELEVGHCFTLLERAARLLTPETARSQFMLLDMFKTEELGQSYIISLTPTG